MYLCTMVLLSVPQENTSIDNLVVSKNSHKVKKLVHNNFM